MLNQIKITMSLCKASWMIKTAMRAKDTVALEASKSN
jgi:hypothetical protein